MVLPEIFAIIERKMIYFEISGGTLICNFRPVKLVRLVKADNLTYFVELEVEAHVWNV